MHFSTDGRLWRLTSGCAGKCVCVCVRVHFSNGIALNDLITYIFISVCSRGNLLRPSSTLFREWATVSAHDLMFFLFHHQMKPGTGPNELP